MERMKAHDVIPGIIGGGAAIGVLTLSTANPAAMAFAAFALAFGICCHNAKAISLRAVIAGILAVPAGVFAIGFLHMDMSGHENGFLLMGLMVFLFSGVSYRVGRKCKSTLAGA